MRSLSIAAILLSLTACGPADRAPASLPQVLRLPAGEVSYRPSDTTLRGGYPVTPAPLTARFPRGLSIMKHQVSQAEYAACVKAGGCKPLDGAHRGAGAPDMPAVGVSWTDASAYAAWLSARTGRRWRLPTYPEWVYAAGEAFREQAALPDAGDDPAQRWLAEYDAQSNRQREDAEVRAFGAYGVNASGLMDMAGSVWDWTSDCHAVRVLDAPAGEADGGRNCGIRIAAGRHVAYLPDFIRDPKSGACSVGLPPANLGLRLVLDEAAVAG